MSPIYGFESRDLAAPDLLPALLVQASIPGNVQLVKGSAPSAVAVLVEFDAESNF